MIKLISPTHVFLKRKTKKDKRISLNLNIYRNLHFILNNETKKLYNEIMGRQLKDLEFENKICLEFHLYKNSKRKIDRSNILCIVEKFFCDSLVFHNCIPDDNDDFIEKTIYLTKGIDRENPRVEILITEVGELKP